MKKQYQVPSVIIRKISPISLICSSIASTSGASDLGISDDGTEEACITFGNSRRGVWDDDEEEEY